MESSEIDLSEFQEENNDGLAGTDADGQPDSADAAPQSASANGGEISDVIHSKTKNIELC